MGAPLTSVEFQVTLGQLEDTPTKIANLLESIPEQLRTLRPSPDEFSANEQVCHLRDIELEGFSVRIRRILSEDNPELPDVDGARLAEERDYNSENVRKALGGFTQARLESVKTLRSIESEGLLRTGILAGVGEINLVTLAAKMREHDLGHLEELARLAHRLRKSAADSAS